MMLEEPELLVCPWAAELSAPGAPAAPAVVRKRLIRTPAGGHVLGFARSLSSSSWWSWLTRQRVQVFETDDASLLMTLYGPRGLRRTWEVRDAEERRVGHLYRHVLWEGTGSRLAVMQRSAGEGAGRFVSPSGTELAAFSLRQEAGILLDFSAALVGKPFARMMLLAAVLSW
jgi:hypothetical protein